jgi:hypothetical protein
MALLLSPIWLPIFLLLAIPAAISIPYFWLFPERHAQVHDFDGTPHQKARLVGWRTAYERLSFADRFRRATKKRQWRRRAGHLNSRHGG